MDGDDLPDRNPRFHQIRGWCWAPHARTCRIEERIMTEFIGWIRCGGRRVLVERIDEERDFHVVRLCAPCGEFPRGQALRVPKAVFEPCAARRSAAP